MGDTIPLPLASAGVGYSVVKELGVNPDQARRYPLPLSFIVDLGKSRHSSFEVAFGSFIGVGWVWGAERENQYLLLALIAIFDHPWHGLACEL